MRATQTNRDEITVRLTIDEATKLRDVLGDTHQATVRHPDLCADLFDALDWVTD